MSRAEMRRRLREERKQGKNALNQMSILGVLSGPERIANITEQDIANARGAKLMLILKQWEKEKEEEIRKRCMIEAQEKLDAAENFITLHNLITSLKALDGYRYAKSAAGYLLEHYNDCVKYSTQGNIKETYQELQKKWGLEIEFEVPDLNKELGFEEVDWVKEYIGMNIPQTVYKRIWEDSENIQAATMQMAVTWELCKDFGFWKHGGKMMERFWKGFQDKYTKIDLATHGITDTKKTIKEKFDIDVKLPEYMQKTVDDFDL